MKEQMQKPCGNAWSRFRQDFFGKPLRVLLLICSDFLWSFLALFLTLQFYRKLTGGPEFPAELLKNLCLLSGLIVVINSFSRCYHGSVWNPGAAINRAEEIRRLCFSVFASYAAGCLMLLISGGGAGYPPVPVILALCVTVIGFPAVRFFTRYCMKKAGVGQIRTFVAGAGKTAHTVVRELESSVYYGYEIVGYFDDDGSKQNCQMGGEKYLGRLDDAPRLAAEYNVQYVICCLPPLALPRITHSYTRVFKHVLVIPSNDVLPITAIYPTLIGFISGFEFQNRILFPFPQIVKRIAELAISLTCLVLLLPVFLVLALLVMLSGPGPVFYTAKRLGLGGREIKVFKFRTMFPDAEERLQKLLEENPDLKKEWQEKFKLQNDPRITPVGRFLRKTSLDELPQFINVLRGEMALIGPRPIVKEEIGYYGDAYEFFKSVRPGITGLWQVSGRSSVDYAERVRMDMFYVMNWSIWLDWFILWKTALVIAMCKGSC